MREGKGETKEKRGKVKISSEVLAPTISGTGKVCSEKSLLCSSVDTASSIYWNSALALFPACADRVAILRSAYSEPEPFLVKPSTDWLRPIYIRKEFGLCQTHWLAMSILSPTHRKLTSCYLNKKKQRLPITKGFWCCKPWAKSGSPFLMVTSSTFIAVISNMILDRCYEGLASFRNNNQKIILLIYIAF